MMTEPTKHRSSDLLTIPGLENDPEGATIVAEELKLLGTVHSALLAADAKAEANASKSGDEEALMLDLREQVAAAKPEDLPTLFEQMHNLGALRAQRGKGAVGTLDRKAPYFGHLRLEETFEGESKVRRRDVLVGGKSYVDPTAGIRIVDWRNAPVSRIFYRYVEGEDYEETLGDKLVEGVVVSRRSVAIVDGVLRRVASPQGTFALGKDGTWRRVATNVARLRVDKKADAGAAPRLGVGADGDLRTDKVLPAIAAMLDKAQFDLITRPGIGLIPIQGSAGSGKTTVGLHRVAYLATTEPQRYKPERMLVVVPNDALIHYVGRVLPSLGVDGVPVTTFMRWSKRVLGDLFPKLPSRITEETPPVVARVKSHSRMLVAIDRLRDQIAESVDAKLRSAMAKWPEGELVISAWAKTEGAIDVRLSLVAAWLAGKRTIAGIAPATSLPDVTRGALERLGQELRKETRNVLGTWDELVTSKELLGETFQGVIGPGQLDQVYEWCVKQSRIRQEGERDGEMPSLDHEDAALILRIFQALRGPLVDFDGAPLRLAHLFVDEVQDASPVELRVLLELTGKDHSITLAGDTAQRMHDEGDDRGEFSWASLLKDLGASGDDILEPLKVSYRSTEEITTFARAVLGPFAHEAEPIATRNGPPVELFTFASPGEAVAFLADALKELARSEPTANVALVSRFSQQADVYFEGLSRAEVPNVRRVRKQDFTWEAGFDVTDIRQTKGLEFDEVILLETNASSFPVSDQARHALYVGATRAAHQLWCVSSEAPSKLVTDALPPSA